MAQGASPAGTPALPAVAGEVRVLVQLQGSTLSTLIVSYPAAVTMDEINTDARGITRWTNWVLGTPQADPDRRNAAAGTVVTLTVTEPVAVQSVLNDVIWPLAAALAGHGRLTVVVMGAQVATQPLRIQTRYATVDQSGGQGVQTYQAEVRDTGFRSLEELKQPTAATAAATSAASPGRGMGLAWVLVIVASLATGVAVYLFMSRAPRRS